MNDRHGVALYRLYDDQDALLYVGISNDWPTRMGQHAKAKGWWRDVATVRRENFPTRAEAEAAETCAIVDEGPRHNVSGARSPLTPPVAEKPPPFEPVVLHEWATMPYQGPAFFVDSNGREYVNFDNYL